MTLFPTSCTLKQELNGICSLELDHPFDDQGRWKYLTRDNVLATSTPWSTKQLFRIYNVVKNMSGIKVFARHVFFDLINYPLLDVRPTDCIGQQALNSMLSNTPFTGTSNIAKLNTAYYVRKNVLEALAGNDENSFVNRWGGERYLDNYKITINEKIGDDYGVVANFGLNLKEIEEDVNDDEVGTRIIPEGYNGIMLDGAAQWVDSPNINKYANFKTKFIKFDDIKVKDANSADGFNTLAEARQAMIDKCNKLFDEGIDQPKVNYKVQMELLQNTTEYKEYKLLETVNLGDTVTCRHRGIDIDIKARCISYTWNCLTQKYVEIELGNFKGNYFDAQSDISNRVTKAINANGNVVAEEVRGIIDATNAKFKAQRSVEQKQHIRAMLFEDLDPESSTFGAMSIGTQGFMIAAERTLDGRDWKWSTFGTGKGFIADLIIAGRILGNNAEFNLDEGFLKVLHSDGSYTKVDAQGLNRYAGTTKQEYHYLTYVGSVSAPETQDVTVTLPSEYRNKKFYVAAFLRGVATYLYLQQAECWVNSIDYENATVTIHTASSSSMNGEDRSGTCGFGYIVIA